MLSRIQACFARNRVLYTYHARREMRMEELGPIGEQEAFEAIQAGEVICDYCLRARSGSMD